MKKTVQIFATTFLLLLGSNRLKAQDPTTIASITVSGITDLFQDGINGVYTPAAPVGGIILFNSTSGFYFNWDRRTSKWLLGGVSSSNVGSISNFPTTGWSNISGFGLSGVPSISVTLYPPPPPTPFRHSRTNL